MLVTGVLGLSAPCWAEEAAAEASATEASAVETDSAPTSPTPVKQAANADATPCVCDPMICNPNQGLPDPNAYRHDGFFLRLTLGMGYMWGRGTPNAELAGYAGALGFSFGSMVSENFGLHFDLSGSNAFRSGLSIDGSEDTTYNAVFQTSGFGLGATYYFMPVNVYASLGVGGGWLYTTAYTLTDDSYLLSGHETSSFGPMVTLSLGKEWWLTPAWGMGVAAMYQFLSVNGEDLGQYTVDNVHHLSVRLSATFN